jgi:hypothetical protein
MVLSRFAARLETMIGPGQRSPLRPGPINVQPVPTSTDPSAGWWTNSRVTTSSPGNLSTVRHAPAADVNAADLVVSERGIEVE